MPQNENAFWLIGSAQTLNEAQTEAKETQKEASIHFTWLYERNLNL